MSGLVQFFQRFMPKRSGGVESNIEGLFQEDYQYNKSLAGETEKGAREDTRGSSNDDNDDDASFSDNEAPDYTEDAMDFEEWKSKRNELLNRYFLRRMFPTEMRESDGGGVGQEGEGDADDTQLTATSTNEAETQEGAPETQEGGQQQQQHSVARPKRKIIIPHYSEDTVHDVTLLDDVDLYTREATFDLCQVTKVFDLRSCKRFGATKTYASRHREIAHTHDYSMPNLLNVPVEEDGPLCTVFKNVLNMEIQQLLNEPPNLSRKAAAAAGDASNSLSLATSRRKLRVFFYNEYARAMRDILARLDPKKQLLLVHLEHVPAACVFPYATRHWYDQQELSDHCICIGGDSSLKADLGEGLVRVGFDAAELRVRVALGDKNTLEFEEWTAQKGEEPCQAYVVQHNSTKLSDGYKSWREIWGLSQLAQEVAPFEEGGTENIRSQDTEGADQPATAAAPKHQDNLNRSPLQQQSPQQRAKPKHPQLPQQRKAEQQHGDNEEKAQSPLETQGKRQQQENTSRIRPARRPPAGLPHAKRAKSHTKYIKLSELRSILESHRNLQSRNGFNCAAAAQNNYCEENFYGVVLGFSAPTRTKRGDWMLIVTLVDESISPADHDADVKVSSDCSSTTLLVFTKGRNSLPRFRSAGDVLRLHRVTVQEYQESMQLLGKRKTGYTVYYGHSSTAISLDQTALSSPTNYSMSPGDEERFYNLWKWGQSRLVHYPTIKLSEMKTLAHVGHQGDRIEAVSSLDEKDFVGDYTVMISAMLSLPGEVRSGVTPMGFLRVWDGTGASESDRVPMKVAPSMENKGDPPTEALVKISEIRERREHHSAFEPPRRLCGRVVNVVIWEHAHWDFLNSLGEVVGRFIRLRNVQEVFLEDVGMRCLQVHAKSWLTPLPRETFEVLDLLANHSKRVANRHNANPNSGVLPLTRRNASTYPASASARTANRARRPRRLTLASFFDSLSQNPVFEGSLCVLGTAPGVNSASEISQLGSAGGYRFALVLSDGSSLVNALVSNARGEQLFGLQAAEACGARSDAAFRRLLDCIEQRTPFAVKIRATERNGTKYFILQSILQI